MVSPRLSFRQLILFLDILNHLLPCMSTSVTDFCPSTKIPSVCIRTSPSLWLLTFFPHWTLPPSKITVWYNVGQNLNIPFLGAMQLNHSTWVSLKREISRCPGGINITTGIFQSRETFMIDAKIGSQNNLKMSGIWCALLEMERHESKSVGSPRSRGWTLVDSQQGNRSQPIAARKQWPTTEQLYKWIFRRFQQRINPRKCHDFQQCGHHSRGPQTYSPNKWVLY